MQLPLSHSLTLLLSTLSLLPSPALGASRPSNAILLSDVQSLTLRAGAKTTHRRVSPIPQLKCVSSPAICHLYEVDVMRCTNQGSGYDSEDVQWACSASLPPELKLGSTDVICEGYTSPNDPYVLRGSCGVEYRLVLTDVGERKFPELATGSGWGWSEGGGNSNEQSNLSGIFLFVFALVCLWIVYSACFADNRTGTGPAGQRRWRDGWGGFGGGGFDPGFGPGGGGGGRPPSPPYSGGPKPSWTQNQHEGWRPGFWTGLAGGAAAGYAAGNRSNRREEPRGYGWGARPPSPPRRYSSPPHGRPDSRTTSSATYESTGFGSTSRR